MSNRVSGESARGKKLSTGELAAVAACPRCRSPLEFADVARCPACGSRYRQLLHAWDLVPDEDSLVPGAWGAWEQLQDNGVVSYREDPEHNLGVGERDDYRAFAEFCELGGLVLDVGCGPQPWPSHFDGLGWPATKLLGVDPLVGEDPAEYTQVRGLAEHLPFSDGVFDHVVYATSLDHFVDPTRALREGARVCSSTGTLDVWIGEKSADAPRPRISHEWYASLEAPDGAEDVFHIKRLERADLEALAADTGLRIVDHREIPVDDFRRNVFLKLVDAR